MKYTLCILALLTILSTFGYSQRYYVETSNASLTFKRHFSYSIEGGLVDNLPRQFIAGNETEWMVNSKKVMGNSFSGPLVHSGRLGAVISPKNIIMSDFVVQPGNYQYAAGTGLYLPNGPNGMGYPFFGIYDRRDMEIISLVYYDVSYPADVIAKNAAGVRIKYSAKENAYYISGIMVDRPIIDMNFDDIQGRSNGFIMKIDQSSPLQAKVLAFSPSTMPAGIPELCSINDMEIGSEESSIVFTGVNTEYDFSGYVQPMVGKIDMNLNLQWCYAYEITDLRYSGIDIEYGSHEKSLFVLMNSETTPFAIMQLDQNGAIMQQPKSYNLLIPGEGSAEFLTSAARAHVMHYTDGDSLIVTGNSFILEGHTYYQDLFSYRIPKANDLSSSDASFASYSRQLMPMGSQIRVTSWWAPENSVYVGNTLSLVGIYNNNNSNFGYSFIYTPGFDNTCLLHGKVEMKDITINHQLAKYTYNTLCNRHTVVYTPGPFIPTPIFITCSGISEKSIEIDESTGSLNWQYRGIDESGIHAVLNAEFPTQYQVNVYDITGRKVYSESYSVKGQKYVYLNFNTNNQIYLISVNNGTKTETLKVSGVR